MKLDLLALAAHPDDIELCASGILMHHIALGYKVGVLDLTLGEMGTRGTVELRRKEARVAAEIMGLHVRDNAQLPDGKLQNNPEQREVLISYIRKYRPDMVLINAPTDRHPDHGMAASLEYDACFLAGLAKYISTIDGQSQAPWRPKLVFHYIQDQHLRPDLIFDITPYYERKIQSIKAYESQFYSKDSLEPYTYIADQKYLSYVEARSIEMGHILGVQYGEGLLYRKPIGCKNLFDLS